MAALQKPRQIKNPQTKKVRLMLRFMKCQIVEHDVIRLPKKTNFLLSFIISIAWSHTAHLHFDGTAVDSLYCGFSWFALNILLSHHLIFFIVLGSCWHRTTIDVQSTRVNRVWQHKYVLQSMEPPPFGLSIRSLYCSAVCIVEKKNAHCCQTI